MTIPDPSIERAGVNPENQQDIIPPTERNQDPSVTDVMRDLTVEGARPLTAEERKAADRDAPVGERVYAPASERVPVDPVPGHRNFIDHTDTHTPEREAAGQTPTEATEPSFTRVTRPGTAPTVDPYTPGAYASTGSKAFGTHNDATWNSAARSRGLPFGLGWITLGICGGLGGWLYLRWQRDRNKPINRIRRQARQAAGELRDRVPSSPEEAVRPAAGLTTALLSILVIMWQQAQARSRQADKVVSRQTKKAVKRADKAVGRAGEAVSDLDWQKRLATLKKRWDPSRLELEKNSISRH
jgi:hypothetical protein